LPKAISLVEELMADHYFRFDVEEISLIPKSGGIFEVTVDDKLIYSKKQTGEFPETEEIVGKIRDILGK
jgi:selenoprotein W-related protein